MCGIVAVLNFNGLNKQDIEYFKHVLIQSEVRGSQATGIGLQDLSVVKAPIKSSDFVKTKSFEDITNKAIGQKWIVGHTRHATQGNPSNNVNNHPLKVFDKALVVHNGIVHSEVVKSDKSLTDSYIVVNALKKVWGAKRLQDMVKDAYKLFYGYAATIIWSKRSIVFSTVSNPLSRGNLGNGSLVFASQSSFFPSGTLGVYDFRRGDCLAYNSSGDLTSTIVEMAVEPKPVYNWDYASKSFFEFEDDEGVQSKLFEKQDAFFKASKPVKVKGYWKKSYYRGWD